MLSILEVLLLELLLKNMLPNFIDQHVEHLFLLSPRLQSRVKIGFALYFTAKQGQYTVISRDLVLKQKVWERTEQKYASSSQIGVT